MQKIEGAVKTVAGVDKDSVNVAFNSSRVRLNFDAEQTSIEQIEDAITKVGYEVKKSRLNKGCGTTTGAEIPHPFLFNLRYSLVCHREPKDSGMFVDLTGIQPRTWEIGVVGRIGVKLGL